MNMCFPAVLPDLLSKQPYYKCHTLNVCVVVCFPVVLPDLLASKLLPEMEVEEAQIMEHLPGGGVAMLAERPEQVG